MMNRKFDGAPIARHHIFLLTDGAFVVQWDTNNVQDILTGKVRPFNDREYGHAITDAELDTLREAGRVSHYDHAYVWLHALPEGSRFATYEVQEHTTGRIRQFYLNTTLHRQHLQQVQQRLHDLGLSKHYTAQDRGGLVAIMNKDGHPFARLTAAENAQNILRRAAPQLLQDAAVAFVEFEPHSAPPGDDFDSVNVLDLETLIASQTQNLQEEGKVVVVVDNDPAFLATSHKTMTALGVEIVTAANGHEALHLIEDMEPDLVLMDLVMPDTHAWEILAKMKANQALAATPVIIVSALGSPADQVFALTVAKVHDYLVKPVAASQLRQSVWTALKNR